MKRNTVPILLIAATIVFAIISFFVLPESVIIQFSVGSSGNTSVPKLVAILIPSVLGIGGAISVLLSKGKEGSNGKSALVSLVGIGLFIVMIAVNAFVK